MSNSKESEDKIRTNSIRGRKIFLVLFILALTAASYYFYAQYQSGREKVQPETALVSKTDLKISFSIDGKLVVDTYEPGFSLSGKVSQVYVKEGDKVRRGQWLASLDAAESQKNLEKALRDFSIERNDFEEADSVTYAGQDVTDTLKRILEKNQWNLDKAVLDVELKDLAVKQSKLIAPADGIVAQLNVKPGSAVSTQNQIPAIVIVVPDSLKFIAFAEEDDVLQIRDGQTARIVLDSYDTVFPANLTFVSPLSTVDANGIASYKIVAELKNPGLQKLIDGMEGSLTFVVKEIRDVLAVPNKAVSRENGKSYVSILNEDGSVTRIEVETGFTDGKFVEIKNNLSPGQVVLLTQ